MAIRIMRNFLEWASCRRWNVVGKYGDIDDIPAVLKSREIVVVATPQFVKWIIFDCPCRTGHRIMVNADPTRRPAWQLRATTRATIWPSIDFEDAERRCHYWIVGGRTRWTRDSD